MIRSASMSRFILLIAAGILASAGLSGPAHAKKAPKKARPIERLDRTRAVGAPVLDDAAKAGVYVWIEDGEYRFAAVPHDKKRPRNETYVVKVSASKDVKTKALGDFAKAGAGRSFALRARVKNEVARGAIETDGNVTVSGAHVASGKRLPIFVGPLAKRAAATVTIGRF